MTGQILKDTLKVACVIAIALFFLPLTAYAQAPAPFAHCAVDATTAYVDAASSDGTGTLGDPTDPYPSLASGLAAIAAGDTVCAAAGVQQTNGLSVNKSAVLLGDNQLSVIDANGGDAVLLMANGITLDGFTVEDYDSGLRPQPGSRQTDDITITNNHFTGPRGQAAPQYNIYVAYGNRITITGNTSEHAPNFGIAVGAFSASLASTDVVVSENTVFDIGGYGIMFIGPVANGQITLNNVSNAASQIAVFGADGVDVSCNTVSGPRGIRVYEYSGYDGSLNNVTVNYNTIIVTNQTVYSALPASYAFQFIDTIAPNSPALDASLNLVTLSGGVLVDTGASGAGVVTTDPAAIQADIDFVCLGIEPPVDDTCDNEPATDGRLNDEDLCAPIAVFADTGCAITVYETNDDGSLASLIGAAGGHLMKPLAQTGPVCSAGGSAVTAAVAQAVATGEEVVIASANGVSIIALPNGLVKVEQPGIYGYEFDPAQVCLVGVTPGDLPDTLPETGGRPVTDSPYLGLGILATAGIGCALYLIRRRS